jgi:uncharacterized OsmC-like protein
VGLVEVEVVVSAGSLRPRASGGVVMPHAWTPDGVVIESAFTGAHLLLLAPAGCVLNDVYREAAALEIDIDGVMVRASGALDTTTWESNGVRYQVEVDSPASDEVIDELLGVVDDVAEIPKTLRAGTTVTRSALTA